MVATQKALPGFESWSDQLAERNLSIWQRIAAASRRRDVQEKRVKIALLLLEMRCPLDERCPYKSWYVPGAVARLSVADLRRRWRARFCEEPPCDRTVRSHLGALQKAFVIVRSPGDPMPYLVKPDAPERRPRFPDTYHLLENDQTAEWWRTEGSKRLREHCKARFSAGLWRRLFARWRQEATFWQRGLPGVEALCSGQRTSPEEPPLSKAGDRGSSGSSQPGKGSPEFFELARVNGRRITESYPEAKWRWEWMRAMRDLSHGFRGEGRVLLRAIESPARARAATWSLLWALARGDRIRNRVAWYLTTFTHGKAADMRFAEGKVKELASERSH